MFATIAALILAGSPMAASRAAHKADKAYHGGALTQGSEGVAR